MSFQASYENVREIADFICMRVSIKPQICIICGSGLGKLAEAVRNPNIVPYSSIPHFPKSTVVGHKGVFVFGYIANTPCVVMQGRFHLYEGYTPEEIALPIRVLSLLGVKVLLLSNAAGGLNRNLKTGDFVLLKDHLNLPGLALRSVLIGRNDEKFGTRFPNMNDAYSRDLRTTFKRIIFERNLKSITHEGVYVFSGGPTYETPAECVYLMAIGADVVGMSTVPEVVVARHCGIKVLAVSLVTNMCSFDVDEPVTPNHDEVLDVAEKRSETLRDVFVELISKINI